MRLEFGQPLEIIGMGGEEACQKSGKGQKNGRQPPVAILSEDKTSYPKDLAALPIGGSSFLPVSLSRSS